MYGKFPDKELIEAYSSMMDYSGKLSDELVNEIELRGGLEVFKKKIIENNILSQEINRISKEIYSLTSSETNVEFIKKLITSDILTRNELNDLIESQFLYYKSAHENGVINQATFISSIFAVIAAAVIGGFIFSLITAFMTPVFIYFIIPIYIIDYIIIRLITKKTRSNLVIFIATLLATIGSILLGLYFVQFMLPAS